MARRLPKGIYTPLPCFFVEGSEDLDLVAFKKHVQYTSKAGTIPVVSGTAGEAPHLGHAERKQLLITAREALDEVGLIDVPIIAGIGAPSTRESVELAHEASDAGADFVIAIAPGYYAGTLMAEPASLKNFFVDIANASPLPVMMYNFPAVSGGIDLDSDVIISIAKEAPNVCGIKLTCANVGKLTRITAAVNHASFPEKYPRKVNTAPFLVIDGFIDFLLPSMASGSSGAITGLANIAPKTCVKLWQYCSAEPSDVAYKDAQAIQNIVSNADGVALKIGIPGMKMLLYRIFGYSPYPRRPLLPMSSEKGDAVMGADVIKQLMEFEESLI